jgi:DMSO/TMAO reductase YedYZ heme-binding membrane subunit
MAPAVPGSERPEARGFERHAVSIAIAGGVGLAAALWTGQVGLGLIGARAEPASQLFSDTTRSLGESGLVLLCLTLALGLALGRRWIVGRRAAALRRAHQALSLTALGVIGLHLATLLGVSSIGPSVERVLVPFVWPHRTAATGVGVLATYLLAGLGPTYYAPRHRARRWRALHPWIVVAVALSALHFLGGG